MSTFTNLNVASGWTPWHVAVADDYYEVFVAKNVGGTHHIAADRSWAAVETRAT